MHARYKVWANMIILSLVFPDFNYLRTTMYRKRGDIYNV